MKCGLHKHVKKEATHYVGKDGGLYDIKKYINHGHGGVYRGMKDLPKDEYPYTMKYETKQAFLCCELCNCD